jgi:hypothetical protein
MNAGITKCVYLDIAKEDGRKTGLYKWVNVLKV